MLSSDLRLSHALAMIGGPIYERVRFELAAQRIRHYHDAARVQVERISALLADHTATHEERHPFVTEFSVRITVEAHFLFICWDAILKQIDALRENSFRLRSPKRIYKKHKRVLSTYQRARDHMEHYDERLPGRKNSVWRSPDDRSVEGSVPGVVEGQEFVFAGERWDVGATCLLQLDEIVSDLQGELLRELEDRFEQWKQAQAAAAAQDVA